MVVIWLTSSFDYFLITYLVNTFKRVYISALSSSLSELVAYAASGMVYEKFGPRITLASSFGIEPSRPGLRYAVHPSSHAPNGPIPTMTWRPSA